MEIKTAIYNNIKKEGRIIMKPIVNGLKNVSTIVIDKQQQNDSEIDSDIEQVYDLQANGPPKIPTHYPQPIHHTKFNKITPIRRVIQPPPKPPRSQKVEQIQIEDESSENVEFFGAPPSRNTEKRQVMKKRLMKVSNKCKIEGKEYSSTECSICLGSLEVKVPSQIGRLRCKHAFCFECISQSSRFSSRCPLCRSAYHYIDRNGEHIQVQAKQLEEDFDPYDDPCYVCGRNDDFDHLLECEYCEAAFCHTYCDNRLESDIPPQESWYCLSCSGLIGN